MPAEQHRPRWGLRTLAWLGLALLSIGLSGLLGHHTLLTVAGLLTGLVGAMFCTARGLGAGLK